jgi:hypothetical protein
MSRVYHCAVLALVLCAAACAPGSSVVTVNVTVASGEELRAVHHFSVSLRDVAHGTKAAPFSIALPSLVTLPPAQRFNLGFDASVNGAVLLHVDAVGADGVTLAGVDQTVTVKPSTTTSVTLLLPGTPAPPGSDGGALPGDMPPAADLPPLPDGGVLTLAPATVMLDAQPGSAARHTFVATVGGVDVSGLCHFTVADPTLGTMAGATFTSAVTRGGTSSVSASFMGMSATATVTVRFHANVTSGCPGCAPFPGDNAPACAASVKPTLVYPPDGALWPPNLGALQVQLTPGSGDTQLELDFANSVTDVRVNAGCSPTRDQSGQASGGCQIDLDGTTWDYVANSNRDGDPVTLTVRATSDGSCAAPSTNQSRLLFAADDLTATVYYDKLPIVPNSSGIEGIITRKDFSQRGATETAVLTTNGTCYGCHTVSRDGARISVSTLALALNDDVMQNMNGALIDVTSKSAIGLAQPTGFQSFAPDHAHYVASDGIGKGMTNQLFLIDGNSGTSTSLTVGAAATRPTQPDWSADGSKLVYVIPMQAGYMGSAAYGDDTHIFGGSLWTASISGGNISDATEILTSAGENNYYPSWSPDGTSVAFNQAPLSGSVATLSNCSNNICPNDSYFNSAAYLMMMPGGGGTPVRLLHAEGQSQTSPNSFPRWAPTVTTYKGQKIAWLSFSSARDYGLRVRNHVAGAGQIICFPPDTPEEPAEAHGTVFGPNCMQPQVWMAGVVLNAAAAKDPSYPAIWLPAQDATTHNIMASWATTAVQ